MNEELFRKYNIDTETPITVQINEFNKTKKGLMRKLNALFDNPDKEAQLEAELELIEQIIDELSQGGSVSSKKVEVYKEKAMVSDDSNLDEAEIECERDWSNFNLRETLDKYNAMKWRNMRSGVEVMEYYHYKKMFPEEEAIMNELCELNVGWLLLYAATRYKDGYFEDPDYAKQFKYLEKAAHLGQKDAYFDLALLYMNSDFAGYDLKKSAISFLQSVTTESNAGFYGAAYNFFEIGEYELCNKCVIAAEKSGDYEIKDYLKRVTKGRYTG